jgi:hypothetical protein
MNVYEIINFMALYLSRSEKMLKKGNLLLSNHVVDIYYKIICGLLVLYIGLLFLSLLLHTYLSCVNNVD